MIRTSSLYVVFNQPDLNSRASNHGSCLMIIRNSSKLRLLWRGSKWCEVIRNLILLRVFLGQEHVEEVLEGAVSPIHDTHVTNAEAALRNWLGHPFVSLEAGREKGDTVSRQDERSIVYFCWDLRVDTTHGQDMWVSDDIIAGLVVRWVQWLRVGVANAGHQVVLSEGR